MVGEVQRGVAEGFGAVADAFNRNVIDPGEDAAAVTAIRRGVKVVDLWSGTDAVNHRPMPADCLMMVASCSKAITAPALECSWRVGLLTPDR